MRSSEEKSFKSRQKKLDKKIKKFEETETKLKQARSNIVDANENEANKSEQSREILSHVVPIIPTHNPFQVLEPTILQTNSQDTDNQECTSLDPSSLDTSASLEPTSLPIAILDPNNVEINSMEPTTSLDSSSPASLDPERLIRTWKCDICEKTIPWGLTFEQILHKNNHGDESKS